jgi:ketosteroid isomerase-like protein
MNNGEIIRSLYEAFGRGDIPTVVGTLDESIEWTEAEGFPYGGTYHGPNAVLENVFMKLGGEWEGFSAVPHKIVDGGDDVVAFGTYTGKFIATGKSISVPYAHSWSLKDGKAVRFQQYTDTLVVSKSLA